MPAARELIELLEQARPIRWSNQVRFDKRNVYDLVAAIRDGGGPIAEAAMAVEEATRNAKPVPLTDQVRLPREHVDELIQGLRTAGA